MTNTHTFIKTNQEGDEATPLKFLSKKNKSRIKAKVE